MKQIPVHPNNHPNLMKTNSNSAMVNSKSALTTSTTVRVTPTNQIQSLTDGVLVIFQDQRTALPEFPQIVMDQW